MSTTTPNRTNRLSDTDLERIGELLKSPPFEDPGDCQAWAQRVFAEASAMHEELSREAEKRGGDFAILLRSALEDRILKALNGRVILTDETEEKSLGVHLTPEGVFVDVRLRLGRWRQ